MTSANKPINYRMIHEYAAGMGLDDGFFVRSGIDPDAAVVCNCDFHEGHESHCDIVLANKMIAEEQAV